MKDDTRQIDADRKIASYELTIGIVELYKLALEREDKKLEDLVASIAWALAYDGASVPTDDEIVSDIGDHIASISVLDQEIESAKSKIKKIRDDRYDQSRKEHPDVYAN